MLVVYNELEIYRYVSEHNEMHQANIKTRCLYCDVGNESFHSVFQMNFILTEHDRFTAIEGLCVCVCRHLQQKLCRAFLSSLPYRIGTFHVETLHFRAGYGVRRCSAGRPINTPNIIWNFIDDRKCFYEILVCSSTSVHIGRNFGAATDVCEKLSLQ